MKNFEANLAFEFIQRCVTTIAGAIGSRFGVTVVI